MLATELQLVNTSHYSMSHMLSSLLMSDVSVQANEGRAESRDRGFCVGQVCIPWWGCTHLCRQTLTLCKDIINYLSMLLNIVSIQYQVGEEGNSFLVKGRYYSKRC